MLFLVTTGAFQEVAIQRAGRLADGWYLNPRQLPDDDTRRHIAAFHEAARAAGREVWTRDGKAWVPFERFEAPSKVREDREPTLRDWRRPLLIGELAAVETLSQRIRGPSRWRRLRRKLRGR